jgi:hypothetical protein
MVYLLSPPDVTPARRISYFKHPFPPQDLQLRTNILSFHAEMLGNFFHSAATIGGEIYLSSALTVPEDFSNGGEMLVGLGAQSERLRLIHRINSMLDLAKTIKNLLVAIHPDRRWFRHD